MEIITFNEDAKAPFKLAIMIKESSLQLEMMQHYYLPLLKNQGLSEDDIICIGLRYINDKAPKKESINWFINNVVVLLKKLKVRAIAIADSKYFQYVTGHTQSKYINSFCKAQIGDMKGINVIPYINYRAIGHNASMSNKLILSVESTKDAIAGLPSNIGTRIVKNQYYPDNPKDITEALNAMLAYPILAVDIEAFSVNHREAGIGTICFSPNEDTCIGFSIQYQSKGERNDNPIVYSLLKNFFELYTGKLIFHRGQYDIKVLVYELFMSSEDDYTGLVHGLKQFDNIEDTMLMTYVCTNNTVQNVLNLKDNTMEFSGNYAIDIKNIMNYEPSVVLEYNGRDTCNTFYLYNKLLSQVENDFYDAYRILLDYILVGVQLEIRGIPLNIDVCKDLYETIDNEIKTLITDIRESNLVLEYVTERHIHTVFEKNLNSTNKVFHVNSYPIEEFNPNSDTQTADLIHNYVGIEPIDLTPTGLPAMGIDTLNKLKHKVKHQPDVLAIVKSLIRLKEIVVNQTNFISKFVNDSIEVNGNHYIHGNIKLCTTISGRPTGGGDINILALPSTGSVLSSPVKQCFSPPEDRIFVTADYTGLEAYCGAVITKDPAMLGSMIHGIDTHCNNATAYFPELLPEHTKLLKEAENASEFYIDDSKEGLKKFSYD